jgi:hypothetical protein
MILKILFVNFQNHPDLTKRDWNVVKLRWDILRCDVFSAASSYLLKGFYSIFWFSEN